jgi:hypothetical protein
MANKYFNVRQGLQTGNITLDATTGNANVGNLSTTDLNVAGNVNSNLIPNVVSGVPSVLTLGSASQPFKELYLSGNVNLPNGHTLTANAASAAFSGNLNVANTLTADDIKTNSITVNTQFTLNSSTNSTSTDTGAFTTTGGVGIKQDVTVGGAINLANFAVSGNTVRSSIYFDASANGINFKFN